MLCQSRPPTAVLLEFIRDSIVKEAVVISAAGIFVVSFKVTFSVSVLYFSVHMLVNKSQDIETIIVIIGN